MNKEKMEKIYETLEKSKALNDAITLFNWDLETEAPVKAVERISKSMGYLIGESYSVLVNDEFKRLIYSIDEENLERLERKIIREIKKETFEKLEKIPKEEYRKYSELKVIATKKWEEAKRRNDFEVFKDSLSEIIEMNKKFIKYRGYDGHPYNTLLEDYEPEMTVSRLDEFFQDIAEKLSPFIKRIIEKGRDGRFVEVKRIFNEIKYDIDKQKKLSEYILNTMGFDFEKGLLKESEHPFTTDMGNKNVRITTHYYENRVLSAIYSTIHEGGHALYEQNIDDEVSETVLGTGTSMGIHESQSRIYENMFGRSREFLGFLYPKLDEMFSLEEKGIGSEDLYRLSNEVEQSLIRIEADELTYPIHILIRYELEKEIFEDLDRHENVDELAKRWAEKYEKYLGVRPVLYSDGILQDVHWSSGLFGYFPSYALGSAYAAQIYNAVDRKMNITEKMKKGDFHDINEILREGIHKFGKTKTPSEIIADFTGEEFRSHYYIDYLIEKFSKIYGIQN